MVFITDTHALVWYFEGDKKLGQRALEIMRDESKTLIIPSIVLAEIKYLFCKEKISLSLDKIFDSIEIDPRCIVYPLDVSVVELMPPKLDIHDAIICATATLYRDVLGEEAEVITQDAEITKAGLIEVVW